MRAVAVLPDGRVVTGGSTTTGGCWCGTRPSPGVGPVELGRDEVGVRAVAVLPDGRVVTGGDDDRPGAGVGPGRAGRRPGRARPPRGRGGDGGGAAGRAGGHRRPRRGRVLVWDPAEPGTARSSSAATRTGWGRWRCCRTGGWSPAATAAGGCWCGTRPSRGRPGRARPPRGRGGGGGGAAGRAGGHRRPTTTGCGCGMCRAAHPALCSHAPRMCSLLPSPHLELASSSVTQRAEFHAGRYAQRHRTRLEPGNVSGNNAMINRRECPQGPG